jgi:hypothetical protein
MSQIMFRCPYTNKPISAGIDLHVTSIRAVADYPISVHCPYCGFQHHGTIGDGCLADEADGRPKDGGAPAERPRPKHVAARMKSR